MLDHLVSAWVGENHAFFCDLLLINDPTFIPHIFGILDLRCSVILIKEIERSDTTNPQSAIRNPQSKIYPALPAAVFRMER